MAISKITLIGFNNYMEAAGDDLFKYLNVPVELDKSLLVNNILFRGGEFEALYGDPYFMQNMIKIWSDKWQRTMQKWVNALNVDYDPLYNYDRHEIYTDTHSETEDINKTENVKAKDNSTSSGTGNTNNLVSAYDSSSLVPHDNTNSATTGTNKSDATTDVKGDQNRKTSGTIKHDAHLYGNIGVTTSQQMLSDELDIQAWNIYEHITDAFLTDMVIYVYE